MNFQEVNIDKITNKNIAAILVKEKGPKSKIKIIDLLTEGLSEYHFNQCNEMAEKLKDRLILFQNLELHNGAAKNIDKKKWGVCYLDSGYYLFVKRKYCNRLQAICDNEQLSTDSLLDNWIYITKRAIHADFKQYEITVKELKNLKEADVLFATSPGRMGDEIGSTFVLKTSDGFIAYRIDWASNNPEISAETIGEVFPQWYGYDKENYSYIKLEMGFGNLLYVKKDIFKEFIEILKDAVHDELGYKEKLVLMPSREKTGIPLFFCGGTVFKSWRYAAKLMLGDKLR